MGNLMLPYHECPSFEVCSCNVCLLDPDVEQKTRMEGEEQCRAHKPTRHRIGSKYPNLLKYRGLTRKEWTGKMRWENMTDTQRDAQREILARAYSKIKKTQGKPLPETKDMGAATFQKINYRSPTNEQDSIVCQSIQE
jgi:hypothetical protein